MKVKFLADASLNASIVTGVARVEPAVDFLSGASLEGLKDDEVLRIAAREARILVTHDIKTMPRHFGQFVTVSQSPGVILISQKTSVPEAIESLHGLVRIRTLGVGESHLPATVLTSD